MITYVGRMSPALQRLWLVLGCALLFGLWLTWVPLTEIDEVRYSEAVREMRASGDYLIPSFNDAPRYQKPIFYYWLQAASVQAFGVHEVAARLPSAVLATVLVLLLHGCLLGWLPRRVAPEDDDGQQRARGAAFLGAAALATMPGLAIWARAATTDVTLTLCIAGALLAMLQADLHGAGGDPAGVRRARRWYLAAGAAIGFGVLTKGPIGLAVPGLVWLVYHLRQGQLRRECARVPWPGVIGLLLLVAAPWFVTVGIIDPAYLQQFFGTENVGRYTTTMEGHGAANRFVGPLILVGMAVMLCAPYVAAVARELVQPFTGSAAARAQDTLCRLRRFAWCWIAATLLLFAPSATQLPSYIQSILPAVALLFAVHLFARSERGAAPSRLARGVELGVFLLLAVVYVGGICYALQLGVVQGPLGGVPFPAELRQLMRILVALTGGALLVGTVAWWRRDMGAVGWGMASWTLFLAVLLLGVAPLAVRSQYERSVEIGRALRALPPGPVVCATGTSESLVYYGQRRIIFAGRDADVVGAVTTAMNEYAGQDVFVLVAEAHSDALTDVYQVDRVRDLGELLILRARLLPVGPVGAQTAPAPARHGRHPEFERDVPGNVAIFRWVNDRHSPALDVFFAIYYWLGNGWFLLPVLAFVYWKRREKLWWFLLAVAVESILVNVLKWYFEQPRPLLALPDVHALEGYYRRYWGSFPSGDAAMAFTIAAVLARGERWYVQAVLWLYGALIAYERMYLGVHYPLDVTVGALLGVLSSYATYPLIYRTRQAAAS